jgi:hypothetical protein
MRETIVRPLGLITSPNKYGIYPVGALSRADNCVMREPGLLSALQAESGLSIVGGATNVRRIGSTGRQLIAVNGTDVYWVTAGGVSTVAPLEDTGSAIHVAYGVTGGISPFLFRSREFVNAERGWLAADYVNPSSASERTLRWAGLPQPIITSALLANANAGLALADNDVVTYAATIERSYTDGYVLISEPSPLQRVKCPAGSGPTSIALRVAFGDSANTGRSAVHVGDVVRIWRSPPVTSVGLGQNTESGVTLYLAHSYTLVAADITAQLTATITDDSDPDSLSQELYTNPGQETLQSVRRRPPIARTAAVLDGFTFYGNTSTPPQWVARVPSGLGLLDLGTAANRARGIGVRGISSGTFTIGSPNITTVSAAQYVGLAVGQSLAGNANATGKTIVALPGGGVVQMSGNAAASGAAGGLYSVDIVLLNGIRYEIPDLQGFIQNVAGGTSGFWSFLTAQTVAYRETPAVFTPAILQLVYNQSFAMEPSRSITTGAGTSFGIAATNGANYDPPVPEFASPQQLFLENTNKNLVYWSWDQQPEAVAPGNSLPVGKGEILASAATRDAIYYFCTDGLYRLSGYGTRSSGIGAQWRVDAIDKTLIIADPHAVCVLRDATYAYTSRGLVEINGAAPPVELTTGILSDLLPGARWTSSSTVGRYFLTADEDRNEVWLAVPGDLETEVFIYNAQQQAFTQCTLLGDATASVFADMLGAVAFNHSAGPNRIRYFDPNGVFYATVTLDLQPIHANDPLTTKQWIDMTVICDRENVGVVATPRFNGTALALTGTLIQRANDARFNFGVPRSAPAVGATLAPGVEFAVAAVKLRGLSLRHEVLTDQQAFR